MDQDWCNELFRKTENCTGHRFRPNEHLILEALNRSEHPMFYNKSGETGEAGKEPVRRNDGLCELGRKIIELNLTDQWYESDSPRDIGEQYVEAAVEVEELCKLGCKRGVDKLIIFDPPGRKPTEKDVATAVMALVGAVYRDGGSAGPWKSANRLVARFGIGKDVPERGMMMNLSRK